MPDALVERVKSMVDAKGRFHRVASTFREFITEDGPFQPEAGRYHLYIAYPCPWAHRTLIARRLKGLENIIGLSIASPNGGASGWPFYTSYPYPGATDDPINNAAYVKDLYLKADPDYKGRFSIPLLWDKKMETIVNNESSEILRIFNSSFNGIVEAKPERVGIHIDLYPEDLRKDIDEINAWVYERINNGVYKCGIAQTQQAYEESIIPLFSSLDRVETILKSGEGDYLIGGRLTEADVRLFTTIVRFDPVYSVLFKCNIRNIRSGYPYINRWLKNLYWNNDAFRSTTNFDHIKRHYYGALKVLNPTGVIPRGPVPEVEPLSS